MIPAERAHVSPSEPSRVAIRVDASAAIGYGHLTRCLALALALRDSGAEPTFLCARLPPELQHDIEQQGFPLVQLPRTTSDADHQSHPFLLDQDADSDAVARALGEEKQQFDSVVVDHYGIDAIWERRMRQWASVTAITDRADRMHDVDVLLDQNLQDRSNRYDGLVPANCQLLLGPRFALLRPEFAARRAGLARAHGQHSVVLFAGGGDPDNVTGSILEAWEALPPSRPALDVIVGAANPHVTKIRERCAALTNVTMHVHTSRMSELLAAADLLIGSAGTVSWERCCLGVPALMVVVADNQRLNARLLARHRTGINLGDAARLDHAALRSMIERVLVRPSLLRRMGERAADLVDGRGAVRAALILRAARMRLRQARSEDASVAWPWRNHPDTRRVSRDPRELTWDEHHAWWNRAVRDEQRKVFVAHCGSCDVGILRLDVAGDSAEISIYLDPGLTRLGLGVRILRLAQQWVAAQLPAVRRLDAYILRDNRASERTFAAAGFRRGEASWHWYRTDGSVRDANAGV